MNSPPAVPDHEIRFLRTVRKALVPDSEEERHAREYPEIFASTDDRQLQQRINSRGCLDYQGLLAAFTEHAEPLNLKMHTAATTREAAGIVARIARETDPEFGTCKHIVQHVHPDIQALRLWETFAGQAISVHTTFQEDPELREKTRASFIGITAADWGIAESATIVQMTAPGRPRSTSLVPSIHIALLRQNRILANLSEAYSMLRRNPELSSVTLISGPSKTADIEAHMVHGAHGPREMHIIVLENEEEFEK